MSPMSSSCKWGWRVRNDLLHERLRTQPRSRLDGHTGNNESLAFCLLKYKSGQCGGTRTTYRVTFVSTLESRGRLIDLRSSLPMRVLAHQVGLPAASHLQCVHTPAHSVEAQMPENVRAPNARKVLGFESREKPRRECHQVTGALERCSRSHPLFDRMAFNQPDWPSVGCAHDEIDRKAEL